MKIVSVKDRAIETYATPFFVRTIAEAIRSFNDETNRQQSIIGDHPEDYDLYEIGEFNNETGAIIGTNPICRARAQDLKRPIE